MTVLARLVAAQPTTTPKTVETPASAPVIEIDKIPETVYFKDLHINGRVTDKSDPTPTLTLNGEKVWFSGSFKTELPLVEGENTLRFAATNGSGQTTEVVLKVTYVVQPPQITVSKLPVKSVNLTEPITIDVQDWYDKKSKIYINQKLVGNGSYTGELALNEGKNIFEITAVNSLGKSSTVTKEIEGMILPPTLNVESLPESTNQKTITVNAWANDYYDYAPSVYVNDKFINVRSATTTVNLKEGPNVIYFKATNYLGKNTVIIKTITLVPSR
jgi:hypothetical protein